MKTRKSNIENTGHYGKVAVLMGGNSAERVISLETGRAVHAALVRQGVNAQALDAREDIVEKLLEGKFERVFIALHGRGGEDGIIQGLLETLNLPYTGSRVLGSALTMDKIRTKYIWQQHGLATPAFAEINSEQELSEAVENIGLPLMVKPIHEGSSCGASKVESMSDVKKAWHVANQFNDGVLAERWVNGLEYTAAILGEEVLPLIRLETPHVFYDYQAKYEVDSTKYICPCGLSPEMEDRVKDYVMKAFQVVGASGWGRVDLFIDDNDEVQLIEVNTIPGMTSHSLVPMAAKQVGLEFDDLVLRILNSSMQENCEMESAIE
jgi:D-alanine-D-alanine ligase